MSRLEDLAAADLGRLLEDGSDLGTDATLVPPAGASLTPIELRIVFGDPVDGLQAIPEGTTDNQTVPATIRLSVVQDAWGRPPQHGDRIMVASGAMAGEWSLVGVQLDQGDGANLALRYERTIVASRGGRQ